MVTVSGSDWKEQHRKGYDDWSIRSSLFVFTSMYFYVFHFVKKKIDMFVVPWYFFSVNDVQN